MQEDADASKYLIRSRECTNCGGTEIIVIAEEMVAAGDKVYPSGSVLCAKCKTPTMVDIYRWTKWKETT